MYLFSRRARLAGGNGSAGVEWAMSICAKVKEITDHDLQLWATVYSPGFGTLTWTTWLADLAALESIGDQLETHPGYLELTNGGAGFLEGGLDDSLLQPIHGMPDPERTVNYVMGVQAVVAGGHAIQAMAAGVELAVTAEAATGVQTMFLRGLTGPYGAVGWLTGFEDIGQLERSQDQLALDPAWLKAVDNTEGDFVEDASITQSTIYRRLV